MGIISAILDAISLALKTWHQERALRNSPAMIQNALEKSKQEARDALRQAEMITANPNSSPAAKLAAMKAIRLAGS